MMTTDDSQRTDGHRQQVPSKAQFVCLCKINSVHFSTAIRLF